MKIPPWTRKISFILVTILVLTFGISCWARSQADRWPTGDEPNYAIMAQQFVSHGNFELRQAFAEKKYLGVFYGWEVEPQVNWAYFSKNSRSWYSLHSVGEAVLVSPAIILAEALHSPPLASSILLTSLLGALTVVALWLLSYELTKSKSGSTIAAFVLMLSTSFLSLTGTMFPDLPTALLLTLAALGLSRLRTSRSAKNYALSSLCAVLLVTLHAKNLLVALTIVGLLLTSLVAHRVNWRRTLLAMLPALVIGALYLFKIHEWYGTWVITQPFSNGQLFVLPLGWSVIPSLFDSTKGLLFNNPAFFLVFAGIPIWYRQDRSSLYLALLLIAPSLLIQSTFNDWAGGYSPIGRYLLAYVIILLPAIAFLWQKIGHRTIAKVGVMLMLGVQALMALLYIARGYMWNYAGEPNPLLANIQGYLHLTHDISSPIFSYAAEITSPTRGLVLAAEVLIAICLFAWGRSVAMGNKS